MQATKGGLWAGQPAAELFTAASEDEPPRELTAAERSGARVALRVFCAAPPSRGMPVLKANKVIAMEPIVAAYYVATGKYNGPRRFQQAAAGFGLTSAGQNAAVGFTSRFSAVPAAREAFANTMEVAMESAQSATIRAEIGPPPNHCQQLVVSSARSTGRPSVPKARGGLPPEVVHTMVQTGEAMHAAI